MVRAMLIRVAEAVFVLAVVVLITVIATRTMAPSGLPDPYGTARVLRDRALLGADRPVFLATQRMDRERWLAGVVERAHAAWLEFEHLAESELQTLSAAARANALTAIARGALAMTAAALVADEPRLDEVVASGEAKVAIELARARGRIAMGRFLAEIAVLRRTGRLGAAAQRELCTRLAATSRAGAQAAAAGLLARLDTDPPDKDGEALLRAWWSAARAFLAAPQDRALRAEVDRLTVVLRPAVLELGPAFVAELLAARAPALTALALPLLHGGLAAPLPESSERVVTGSASSAESASLQKRFARWARWSAPQLRATDPGLLARLGSAIADTAFVGTCEDLLRLDFGSDADLGESDPAFRLRAGYAVSAALGLLALLFGAAIALPLGLWWGGRRAAARWVGPLFDLLVLAPTFWVGMLAIQVWRGVLPVHGLQSPETETLLGSGVRSALEPAVLFERFTHLVVPASVLALPLIPVLARVLAAEVERHLKHPCLRAARSRGASPATVYWRDLLPLSLTPWISLLAGAVPGLIGGSVVIEHLFGLPGAGAVLLEAAKAGHRAILVPSAAAAAALAVLGLLCSDLLLYALDPRVRGGGGLA